MQRTASVTFHVSAECEACSHQYDYDVTLSNSTSTGLLFCPDPTTGLMEKIQDGKFGVQRCPHCRYLQSWMVKQWKDRWETAAVIVSIPFFIIVGKLIGWPWPNNDHEPLWGYFIDISILISYFLLFCVIVTPFYLLAHLLSNNPNKEWHEKNGPVQPFPKFPMLTPRS